jgi:GNAT superfamily N-acetyltransferase
MLQSLLQDSMKTPHQAVNEKISIEEENQSVTLIFHWDESNVHYTTVKIETRDGELIAEFIFYIDRKVTQVNQIESWNIGHRFVDPEWRGKGIFSMFITSLQESLQQRGSEAIIFADGGQKSMMMAFGKLDFHQKVGAVFPYNKNVIPMPEKYFHAIVRGEEAPDFLREEKVNQKKDEYIIDAKTGKPFQFRIEWKVKRNIQQ